MHFDFLQNIRWDEISPHTYALYGLLALCVAGQLSIYFGTFRRVIRRKALPSENKERSALTVVVCAKNEQENLAKNLPLILGQDYPKFEVVVVNDCSTDDSEMLLYTMRQNYPNLKVTNIGQDMRFSHDRKLAIAVGIKAASNERVVFVEPDCAPPSTHWLAAMNDALGDGALAIGYYRNEPRAGLSNKIIRADSIYTMMFALRAAMKGKPYRATFKNMAMKRALFFEGKGFAKHTLLPLSEDTLFVCRNANKVNTRVALSADTIPVSQQALTFKQWFWQKRVYAALRNIGKRGSAMLRFEMVTRVLYMASAVTAVVVGVYTMDYLLLTAVAPLILLRFVAKAVMLHKAAKALHEPRLLTWQLLYDICSPLLIFVVQMTQPNLQKIKKFK